MSRKGYSLQAFALSRIYYAQFGKKYGTVFTMEMNNKQYLITAKHLSELMSFSPQNEAVLPVFYKRKIQNIPVKLVGHCPNEIDISVLTADSEFKAPITMTPDSPNYAYGEDVYFFGFPYPAERNPRLVINDNNFTPFVKKGAIAYASQSYFFIDGHSNPGFSGGPVVMQFLDDSENPENDLYHVIGVVRGYQTTNIPVFNKLGETMFKFNENSGITLVYDIQAAVNVINANPIGVPINHKPK